MASKRVMAMGDLDALIPLAILGTVALAYKAPAGKGNTTGGGWLPPAAADPYLKTLTDASALWQLPHGLLARVAYQESRFRPDIIRGNVVSSAGAQGIMQIVPVWHPGVDPLNPTDAIFYAAKYLHQLYGQFGSWEKALAAYNWGPGNLRKFLNGEIASVPKETRDYVAQITGDVFGHVT